MEIDREIRDRILTETKSYLERKKIPYRYITIREGKPVVIVSNDTLYKIMDGGLTGERVNGRFIAQGENGWSAYVNTNEMRNYTFNENLTEYQASRFVLGIEYGRKPRFAHYGQVIS